MASPEPAPPLTFRPAGPADIAPVVALVESAYRGDASRAGWTTEADLLDGQRTDRREVARIVAAPDRRLLLAEAAGDLVACCQLADLGVGRAYLGMFAVRPTGQGRGVGRAVLAEAERRVVREWGASEMRMTVIRQRSELIAWYERRGYQATGEVEPFPYGDERFGLPRRADLAFLVLAKPLTSV